VTFTATAVNGGTTPAYAWFVNGVSVGSNSSTFTSSTLNNGDAVTCVLTSNATCVSGNPATSNVINMTVNPDQPVSVSIAGVPPGAICTGTSVTFVATPVNGGNNPVYAWLVNGAPVGSNSSTYTTSTLANNDVVTCVLTSNATCATGNPATSNAVTMAVNPVLTPVVNISASSSSVCAGAPVTFTAVASDAGTTPVYAWYVNGSLIGPNSATYTSSSLNNGDVVTCTVLSNATCSVGATATSNAITVTVNPVLTAGVGITAAPGATICEGTTVNFTATPVNGGTSPAYNWYANGIPVGTGATYSSSTLADGNVITCEMTSDATCVIGNPATSNAVTMSVGTVLPASVTVAASPVGTVCSGEPVTFTATAVNGGSNPVYTWFVNGSAVGANTATFISSSLLNGDAVTCTVTSELACASGNPATSAPVVMSINTSYPVSVNVVAAPAGAVCSGEPVTFTATAVNGGTTPVYQWYVNGIASGSNSDTYISSSLVNGDVVTCEVTSDLVCAMNNPATSAPVTMTVNTTLPVSVTIDVTPAVSVCEGTMMTFTATGVNGGTSPVYEWTVNGTVVGTNSNTFASSTLINGDVVSCTFTSNEICTSNNPAASNNIAVVIASYTVGGVMSSMEAEVCEGSSTGTIILSGYVGDILYWQRRIDGGIWTNIPGTAGFGTYSEITTASGVWEYRAVVQSGDCNVDTSSLIGINVLATPVASFTYNLMDPTVEFVNTSLNATSYNWTFGDGNSSTEVNPTHTYASDNSYTVTLTAHNGICENVYTTTVDIIASSVIELEGLNIAMFPNPSDGEFDITLSGNNNGTLQMEIHDVTGRLIRNENLSSMGGGSVFHVSLGEVNAGLYSVRFIYNDNSITRIMVVE
jgi:PKD repeat protein